MSEGPTVDGGLLETLVDALLEALSVPPDPPHPAVISAAAVKIEESLMSSR